jgi:hypothetical protein
MPINMFTTLDDPSASSGTFADGINSVGQIVGAFNQANSFDGFVRNSDGTFITLNDMRRPQTAPAGAPPKFAATRRRS